MQEPIATYQPAQPGSNKNKSIGIVIIIVIALVGGFLLFRQSKKTDQTKVAVTETITPSPTEKLITVDKKSVKIQVLNGTGTPGQAGSAVELLENAGYNPDNIKTGNTEEFDHTTTTIAAKDGFEDVAKDIEKALKESFDEISIDSTALDADSEFDIVVTTGGKIFEEPTSTPGPTSEVTTTPTATLTPSSTPTPTP